ncbi:rod shape-determining protein RodA [Desulfosporosinus orientis DSM 765]|uniref:Peptidoglycan glycosyltransferase RodA n=1 Tax=Desulfosporosinus orientis (strain ATCC 19365 / DSM 765 / NCIMB 8382 / VKM B-1628 / Singapore I) TaxID=768706 RepID=G7W782_DESOD|nr:rod shape-determining protein RodA [Desulfosporosinus orientis]AET70590.1 rod shape-determining protein RodA [Desulfosporosinus orientis DSM 765]
MDRRALRNLDLLFILFTFLLLAASLVILSTASINVIKSDPMHYVETQTVWIITGIAIAVVIAVIDYQKWQHFRWWIYGFNLLLLLAVIFFGDTAKGATRWIYFTPTIGIQPSEFAKIFIIITFADFLTEREGRLNNIRDFIPPFLFVLVPMLLIFKQPDLGTTLVFAAIFVGMMFVAGANPWKFGGLLLGGVVVIGVALWLHFSTNLPGWLQWAQGLPLPLQDYQLNRLVIFMNPAADQTGDGWHILQSLWAIGSGGLWGKGYRMGTQGQLNFLPEHHTDFIFSVVGEEFGFIGTITLLFLFLIFLLRSIYIALRARDMYGMLVSAGVVSMFTFHILVNVGMTSGIMPVTGIPLPLISAGGSAMWSNMAAIGLLLSVNLRHRRLMF